MRIKSTFLGGLEGLIFLLLACQAPGIDERDSDCDCSRTDESSSAYAPTIADYQEILQLVVERPSFAMFDSVLDSSKEFYLGLEHVPIESLHLLRNGKKIPMVASLDQRAVPSLVHLYNLHIEAEQASLRYEFRLGHQKGRFEFRRNKLDTGNLGTWEIHSETGQKYQYKPLCSEVIDPEAPGWIPEVASEYQ